MRLLTFMGLALVAPSSRHAKRLDDLLLHVLLIGHPARLLNNETEEPEAKS
jgi:hypothetical protein